MSIICRCTDCCSNDDGYCCCDKIHLDENGNCDDVYYREGSEKWKFFENLKKINNKEGD